MDKDQKLILSQISKGNKRAFEQVFKEFYPSLCLFANQYIPDKDDTEEIVQGFFLKLWEKRKTIKIQTSLKNYLFSSVRNHCLNFIKHEKIKRNYQEQVLHLNVNDNYDPSDYLLEKQLATKIENTINNLPEKRREIFILSREDGLKYREIAEKLNISVKTVETQMGKALKELRENLKEYKNVIVSFFICIGKGIS